MDQIFGQRHAEDESLVAELCEDIRRRFPVHEAHLYFPLGIGSHVDHVLLYEVGQCFVEEGYDVIFYEDFPYAAKPSDRQTRMATLPHLQPVVMSLQEEDVLAKIEAFQYYRSQVPMVFGDYSHMPAEFIDYAKVVGGTKHFLAERFWFDARHKRLEKLIEPERITEVA